MDTMKSFEDVLPEQVFAAFHDLRRGQAPEGSSPGSASTFPEFAPTFPLISRYELSLKEALTLFPAPGTTFRTLTLSL